MDKNIGLVIIDYLQLMKSRSSAERRDLEISEMSRSLKALAKELEIPVLAISQLNRMLEQRNDKRPKLSDLRESGALEQDADVVAFIYRDEIYNQDENNPLKRNGRNYSGQNNAMVPPEEPRLHFLMPTPALKIWHPKKWWTISRSYLKNALRKVR